MNGDGCVSTHTQAIHRVGGRGVPGVVGANPSDNFARYTLNQQELATAHPLLSLSAKGQAAWNAVWNDVRTSLEARS